MTRPSPLAVECPYCWAAPGEVCYIVVQTRKRANPHRARVRAAEKKEESRG